MIAEFLNRDVVLSILEDIRALGPQGSTRRDETAVPEEDAKLVHEALSATAGQEESAPSGPRSYLPPSDRRSGAEDEPPPIEDRAFISSDPVISLLQSALDELYHLPENEHLIQQAPPEGGGRRGGVAADPVTDLSLGIEPTSSPGRRILEKFSITDAGWIRCKLAEGIRLFRKRYPFNEKPADPKTMPERARLVLAGDWGSGVPRALKVAEQMRIAIDEAKAKGVATHVIHLGDVYYSGWGKEYKNRFLAHWPVAENEAATIGSWCLNGNHDMYSGGHAYFGTALGDPRFKDWQSVGGKPSSFFSLVNKKWKVLGLDTAWDDGGFKDPQADWLRDELADAKGQQKTLLLSHHQFMSAYESGAKNLIRKVSPILQRTPATAWIWGHEHRCMHYSRNVELGFGRCLGDGGVPVYQWHKAGSGVKAPGTYEHRGYIDHGLEHWAKMGFAVLDFIDDRIDVRYLDEDGHPHVTETIR